MGKYTTISVPEKVKVVLEKEKGDKEWGTFLIVLIDAAMEAKRDQAFKELTELLTEEDLERIEKSSKEFRKEFKLR